MVGRLLRQQLLTPTIRDYCLCKEAVEEETSECKELSNVSQ